MKNLILLLSVLILFGCNATTEAITKDMGAFGNNILNSLPSLSSQPSNNEVSAAFKQALTIGTENVVSQLGQTGGFTFDPQVHIPLPGNLAKAQSVLQQTGLSYLLDDLEKRLNLAAEVATPHAQALFIDAISQMTFTDVMNIYNGSQDSATQYFRSKMSGPLSVKMQPFVQNAIGQAGVVTAYDNVVAQYQNTPFMPDLRADLTNYVVQQGIDGIFFYLAAQERDIRQNPARQTTELLKKVFGNKSSL